MTKKISLYLFAGILSIMTFSGCKVFNKKKCDCPKFSQEKNTEVNETAFAEDYEFQERN